VKSDRNPKAAKPPVVIHVVKLQPSPRAQVMEPPYTGLYAYGGVTEKAGDRLPMSIDRPSEGALLKPTSASGRLPEAFPALLVATHFFLACK
jgi:hypothetical protein